MSQRHQALVADDQPHIVLTLDYLLRSTGAFDVLTTGNGQEALVLATERKPDLILMDVMMPLLDGYAACQAIRQAWGQEHRGQIWIITARGSNIELDQARQAGADQVITKPFDPDLFLRQVRQTFQLQPAG